MPGGIDVNKFIAKDNVKNLVQGNKERKAWRKNIKSSQDLDEKKRGELRFKWKMKELDETAEKIFDQAVKNLDKDNDNKISKKNLENFLDTFNNKINNQIDSEENNAISLAIKAIKFELNGAYNEIKTEIEQVQEEKQTQGETNASNSVEKIQQEEIVTYGPEVYTKKLLKLANNNPQKVRKFWENEKIKQILTNLPEQAKQAHEKLARKLKEKGENVDDTKIQKDIQDEIDSIVKFLWKGETPQITPNQIADKLYYEYTGAILSAKNMDIQTATAYELDTDANDSGTVTERLSTRKEWKRVWKDLMTHLNGDRKFKGDEKRLMKTFVELVIDLENNEATTNNENIEKVILDIIAKDPNAALWNTEKDWIRVMKDNNITVENRSKFAEMFWGHGTKALQQIAQAYVAANNINGAGYSQFPWFRRFTNLIRKHGSFEAAYQAFDQQMEDTKTFTKKNKERTERFNALTIEGGKYKDISINIDTQITMLADFNLDGNVNYGDAYNKTGLQFREMMNQGDKGNNLKNLIAAFNQGKDEKDNLTKEAIFGDWGDNKANLENFTALQDFVKAPPIDLNLIIKYGADALTQNIERAKEQLKLKKQIKIKAKEATEEAKFNAMTKKNELSNKSNPTEQDKMQMKALEQFLSLPDDTIYHGLKDLLEWQLANMTQNGAGLAVGVSLDRVLEWLSFNLGWANNEDWTKGFGVNLSWNGSAQLWNRGGVYGWISGGTVLLTVPIVTGNVGVYHSFENKNRNDSLDTDKVKTDKVVNAGAHAFAVPWLAGRGIDAGIDANRRDAVEARYRSLLAEGEKFWNELLDAMTDEDNTKTFTYNVKELESFLEEKYPKTKNFDKVIKNMKPLLQFYSGQMIDDTTKAVISQNIIESYATTWKNEAIQHLDDKGWYLSGGGLSVSFLEGIIPVVGILKFKKHRIETSADTQESMKELKAANEKGKNNRELSGNLNAINIKEINTTLWKILLSESSETNGTEGKKLIKIDMTQLEGMEIRIDPAMEGLMKKDNSWDILIHPDTPVRAFKWFMNDAQKTVLNIGDNKSEATDIVLTSSKDIDSNNNLFTDKDIDSEKLPSTEKVELTKEKFKEVKTSIVNQLSEEDIQYISDIMYNKGINQVSYNGDSGSAVNIELKKWQDLVITVGKNGKRTLSTKDTPENKNFSILMNIEGKDTVEDEINVGIEAQQQIDDFYAQMPKITSNVLANIAHNPNQYWLWNLSSQWRQALKTQDFATAQTVMITMLPIIQDKVNKYESAQNKVDFFEQVNFLQNEQNTDTQKRQLLLALDGMFSRTQSVRGKIDHYELNGDKNFENITTYNKDAITQKMLRDGVDQKVVTIYEKMFNTMNEQYKTLDAKNIQTKSLIGIAYNFGNGADNERPIYNPKIVAWSLKNLSELWLNADEITAIKLHTAEQMINQDKALIQPLIDKLNNSLKGRGLANDLSNDELITLIATWKLEKTLDNGKKIIINSSYDTMVALFAQCINHMVVAQDFKFQVDWKNIVGKDKNISAQLKGEWGNVTINNAETNSAYTTTTKNFQVAAAVNIKKEETPKGNTDPSEETPEGGNTDPSETNSWAGNDVNVGGVTPDVIGDGTPDVNVEDKTPDVQNPVQNIAGVWVRAGKTRNDNYSD